MSVSLSSGMGATLQKCQRCGKALARGEGGPVPKLFRLMAAMSLAAVHAGMWLWEEMSGDFCGRCRKWLAFLCVVLAGMVLAGVAAGLRWALRQGIF